jgi:hypothetical protein
VQDQGLELALRLELGLGLELELGMALDTGSLNNRLSKIHPHWCKAVLCSTEQYKYKTFQHWASCSSQIQCQVPEREQD